MHLCCARAVTRSGTACEAVVREDVRLIAMVCEVYGRQDKALSFKLNLGSVCHVIVQTNPHGVTALCSEFQLASMISLLC